MGTKRVVAMTALGVMVAAATTVAHHAFSAEFDPNRPVSLTGTITKAEWVNPHAWVYIDVKDPSGQIANWAIEMGPPSALLRRGWRKSSMPHGSEIKVEGFAAKNGKNFVNATDITLSDGTKIFAGSDEPRK